MKTDMTTPTTQHEADERAKGIDLDKLLTIIAYAYQIAGAHGALKHVLDVLADPEAATTAQIEAMLPYTAPAPTAATDQPSAGPVDDRTGALIAAADEHATAYDGDDRSGIKNDVINAFYAGSEWQRRCASLTPTAPQAAGQQADAAEAFCDSHCVWTDHHPECKIGAPQAATTAACQPSTLTGQPDAAICQPAATTASASLDQQMNAVMAVPDERLDEHLRSIGLDPAECEAAGQRALAGAINAVATTAGASDKWHVCQRCGTTHFEGWQPKCQRCNRPMDRAPAPSQSAPDMRLALEGLLSRYLNLANSGDAGNWDPETEEPVIAARAALARAPLPAQAEGTAKRLRDLAAGRITGEIPVFEYSLAADRIQDLEGLLEQAKRATPVQAVDVARDAARFRWREQNRTWSTRYRIRPGRDLEWQMLDDGEPWGQWGDLRKVIDAAMSRTNTTGGSDE